MDDQESSKKMTQESDESSDMLTANRAYVRTNYACR